MVPEITRPRSRSEVTFTLLRTLMTGYRLWGTHSGFEVAQLSRDLRATDSGMAGVLADLAVEGFVALDSVRGIVRLTDRGIHDLLGTSHG